MNKFQKEIDRLAKAGISCLDNVDLKPDNFTKGGCCDVLVFGTTLRFYEYDPTSIVARRTIDSLLEIRNLIDNQIDMLSASIFDNNKLVLAMKEHILLKAKYDKLKKRTKELEAILSTYKEN